MQGRPDLGRALFLCFELVARFVYSMISSPVMTAGWMSQWKWYVPGSSDRRDRVVDRIHARENLALEYGSSDSSVS